MIEYVSCGSLIDGTGGPPSKDVVLRLAGQRIAEVAPAAAVEIPAEAEHLDLSGFTVLPGLVECEEHLSVDFKGGLDPYGGSPAYLAIKGVHYARILLKAGITTCRDLHEAYGIDIAWKQAIAEGIMVGPRILTSCNPLTITGGVCHEIGYTVEGPVEIKKAIRELAQKGADVIKVIATGAISNPPWPAENAPSDQRATTQSYFGLDELTLMADTAHQVGLPITAHAHGGPAARWLVEAGFDAIQHGTFFSREDLERMAERGTILVATTGYLSPDPGPEAERWAFEAENFKRALDSAQRVYATARELGLKVAVGTDAKHGAIPGEIRFLVAAGWTPMEAIVAATKNGAETCRVEAGTLSPGKFADLIAVEGDPLEDLGVLDTVHLVMKEGVVQTV